MKAERCVVCGFDITGPDSSWDAHKASWGPVTIYFHPGCERQYKNAYAPKLRDAVLRLIRRWGLQAPKGT